MSYICLISDGKSAAIAGDTRKNYLAMHSNSARKVFSRSDGKAIWACCGLMHLGLKDCTAFAQMVLSQKDRTAEKKLAHIAHYVRPLLVRYCRMTGKSQGFTVLYAEKHNGNVACLRLDVNTERHSIHKYDSPVFLESGSGTKYSSSPVNPVQCGDIAACAAKCTCRAIQSDILFSGISSRQTVGGHVRVKILK